MEQTPMLVVSVGGQCRTLDPAAGPAVIGRDISSVIPIPDDRISRRHVRLEPHPGGWLALDTSTNGVYFQGQRYSSVPVADGMTVHLGHPNGIPLGFQLGGETAARHIQPPDPAAGVEEITAVVRPETTGESEPDDDDDSADDSVTHPDIAQVGHAVGVRREQLGLSQRQLSRDGVITTHSLIALEKGRRWPRPSTRARLEAALQWPPGTLERLRGGDSAAAETTATTTGAADAPFMADVVDVALAPLVTAIEALPAPSAPDFTVRASELLADLRRLEQVAANAARSAKGSPAVALSLGMVRRRYHDLMLHAASAPGASLGQRLYAARHASGLTIEEVANVAGVEGYLVAAAEADGPVDPVARSALEDFTRHVLQRP